MLTLKEHVVLWLTILKNANETTLQRINVGVTIDEGLNDRDNALIECIARHYHNKDEKEFELIQQEICEYLYSDKPNISIPGFVEKLGTTFHDLG